MVSYMNCRKVVYIIPGMGASPRYKPFLDIAKIFRSNGITPILVSINWDLSIEDYVGQFIKKYNAVNKRGDKVYLFGFSAGAWIALMASIKLRPYMVILCSPSPYFKEDAHYWKKKWIKELGENRFQSFSHYEFKTVIKKLKSNVLVLVGKNEYDVVLRRARAIHKSVKNSRLIVIKSGEHNIRGREYRSALKKNLTEEQLS